MAKKPKKPAEDKSAVERFGDWDFDNVIHQDRDQQLVPDEDNEDPNPLANTTTGSPRTTPKPDKK